ncbi:MAG: FAD:protein FMN transferase, partial [Clostridiaceae bacterium]|nr:FAD:protein FMN transferase [Clostridiaceae bacterium]
YNNYDDINNMKTINDYAGIAPIKVDKKIIDLLLFSKEQYHITNGNTNIALGSVLKVWHEYRTNGVENPQNAKLPPTNLLSKAALHTNIEQLIINTENSTVFLADPEMSLDVGAVAKGYATEQTVKVLRERGYNSALISVGGNVCAIGGRNDDKPWVVGIENPDKESEKAILHNVLLTDASLVTSGDYSRYYTVDGKRYHHIIDPKTLYPAEYCAAVTILCNDSAIADALSTAVFNMPVEEGSQFIESIPNVQALWVLKNGEIRYSNTNSILKWKIED